MLASRYLLFQYLCSTLIRFFIWEVAVAKTNRATSQLGFACVHYLIEDLIIKMAIHVCNILKVAGTYYPRIRAFAVPRSVHDLGIHCVQDQCGEKI